MAETNIGATSVRAVMRLPLIAAGLPIMAMLLILTGCGVTVQAYPINQQAQQIGIIDLSYEMGFGRGPVTIKTRDGATATGEFQTFYLDRPPPNFGALYRAVYKNPAEPALVQGRQQRQMPMAAHSIASIFWAPSTREQAFAGPIRVRCSKSCLPTHRVVRRAGAAPGGVWNSFTLLRGFHSL